MILNHLQDADLQIDIWKCEFNVEETVFLEVIVSEQDLCINFIKVKAIVNWATFTNLKEIQDFVDFVNFYQRFIKNFSKLVKLFTQLIQKDTSFVWNKVCIEVFDNLKKQISSISVLRHFDVKHQAILKIDAFNYVKDDILSQYDDENVLHSIVFYSKSMVSAECNYHIYDKKLLTIIWCFKHWWLELEDTYYDSSYASMLIAMLMTMSMTMFMTIVDRSSLDYRIVSKSTLFRVSLCFSESYK